MLKTAMIFGDRMVLQREMPVCIWGTAEPGAQVTVCLDGCKTEATADPSGDFTVCLPSHQTARGLTMTISSGNESLVYRDVSFGEVWIAGGQSNMEYYLGFEKHFEEIAASFESADVRFFDYPEVAYEGELNDRNYKHEGFWRKSTKEDLGYFSAVGFYFAKALQAATGVPVGIVGCNWGGTTASAWMDPDRLVGTPGEVWLKDYKAFSDGLDMKAFLEEYLRTPLYDTTDRLALPFNIKSVKIGLRREEQAEAMHMMAEMGDASGFAFVGRPGGLYHTMLKKIAPYAARGVIWYQGESDGDAHPEEYGDVFSRMIANWRELWHKDLPFLFVQLAPFGEWMMCRGDNYGIVRDCQEKVSKTVPGTWMTTSGDVGMEFDIHPKNKKPIGERLALLALGHVYGEDIQCDPPEVNSVTLDNGILTISFRYAEGLFLQGQAIQALQLEMEDGSMTDITKAQISGESLLIDLSSNGCSDAQKIRRVLFAQQPYYEVNLYNKAGIPAKPFRWERS